MSPGLIIIMAAFIGQADDDGRLSTADLPAYLEALEPSDLVAQPVGFGDLWEHPERYRGRRVQVRGAVVRRFEQPGFGGFPPLTELWLRTPADNPICLVYPTSTDSGKTPVQFGAFVLFEGTYLRRIRYQGGDGPRLAPLVVGGEPPRTVELSRTATDDLGIPAWLLWAVAVPLVAVLGLLMAWLHLHRPPPVRPQRDEVDFLDGVDDLDSPDRPT